MSWPKGCGSLNQGRVAIGSRTESDNSCFQFDLLFLGTGKKKPMSHAQTPDGWWQGWHLIPLGCFFPIGHALLSKSCAMACFVEVVCLYFRKWTTRKIFFLLVSPLSWGHCWATENSLAGTVQFTGIARACGVLVLLHQHPTQNLEASFSYVFLSDHTEFYYVSE